MAAWGRPTHLLPPAPFLALVRRLTQPLLRRALAHELGAALLEYDGALLRGSQPEELSEALAAAEDDGGDLYDREFRI